MYGPTMMSSAGNSYLETHVIIALAKVGFLHKCGDHPIIQASASW